MRRLAGLDLPRERTLEILTQLGFPIESDGADLTVQPPTWRRDVEGKADLVEEVARIAGYRRPAGDAAAADWPAPSAAC